MSMEEIWAESYQAEELDKGTPPIPILIYDMCRRIIQAYSEF